MPKNPPWNAAENAALVRLYFRMLDGSERVGVTLNKAALIRMAQGKPSEADRLGGVTGLTGFAGQLPNRSRASIEFKLMNASAGHEKIRPAAVTMDGFGYRKMPNLQAALLEAMQAEIDRREAVRAQA